MDLVLYKILMNRLACFDKLQSNYNPITSLNSGLLSFTRSPHCRISVWRTTRTTAASTVSCCSPPTIKSRRTSPGSSCSTKLYTRRPMTVPRWSRCWRRRESWPASKSTRVSSICTARKANAPLRVSLIVYRTQSYHFYIKLSVGRENAQIHSN